MTHSRHSRFSMLELVVVMVLLVTIAALVAPRLTGFFGGRRLDDEARRLWALTRYAREQAIDRALPVELSYDTDTHQVTLEARAGYGFDMPAQVYDLSPDVTLTAAPGSSGTGTTETGQPLVYTWLPDGTLEDSDVDGWLLFSNRNPTDAWLITRQEPMASFTLEREHLK